MISHPLRFAGLIGHPVAHSISPKFQQAAFDSYGLEVHYELWDTDPQDLAPRMTLLRGEQFLGANVTIPHKPAILALVDSIAEEAQLTGAANTIVNRDGRLEAHNTDVGGFARALSDELDYEVRGRRVGLLGAGGTARAVIAALVAEGASAVLILNRTRERAEALVEDLGPRLATVLEAGPLDGSAGARLSSCNMVVNCTSVGLAGSPLSGLSPVSADSLPPGAVVVDVVANPIETPLLQAARARGHTTLGGLPMLVHQGALSFQLWTGLDAPVEVMMAAARKAMAGVP